MVSQYFIQNKKAKFSNLFNIKFYHISFFFFFWHTQFSKVAGNASSHHMKGFTHYVCTYCFNSV